MWWKIPQHTKIPNGLHVSLGEDGGKGKHHFTIRPLQDMPLSLYLTKLQQLESSARPCFINSPNSQVG
ncbi:Tse2 family ADP-ribosyltransferase toxin [Vibrio alginolyticus]|uniref:Tse2 family ADP-ribosyltransferase toxin n=1 Tax=Vibrio alginolyticus TaxID=663 RepID=UPI003F512EDB